MHLMIFSPGKVESGFIGDDATMDAIYDMMYTSATTEQGNGKVRKTEAYDGMGEDARK